MKVVFKLSSEQAATAKAIVSRVATEGTGFEDEPSAVNCGNLIGTWGHGFSFNPNQNLWFDEEKRIVTYEGERHPLVQDKGLTVLADICSAVYRNKKNYKEFYEDRIHAVKALNVVLYETTDRRLQWFQTSDDIWEQMSLEELINELGKFKEKRVPHNFKVICMMRTQEVRDIEAGTPAYRRIMAEGRYAEWRLGKIVSNW